MATDEYVVMKANQRADSDTFQMVRIISPMIFHVWDTVIAQAGPKNRSDAKHTARV